MDKVKENEPKSIWDNSMEQYIKGDFNLYWELLPLVQKYQLQCMTGDENKWYISYILEYIKEHIGTKNLRALSVGCNEEGIPEVEIYNSGMFSKVDVMDIAGGLLTKQAQKTKDSGIDNIEYLKCDFNTEALNKNAYDLIFAVGTVHHLDKLEFFFDGINGALKDNGVFMLREYVGPSRFQFTKEQVSICNKILATLPERYKTGCDGTTVKRSVWQPTIEEVIKTDPSESIRSADIIRILKDRLDVIKLSYTGGTILYPLLSDIASNFEISPEGETILKLLILFEKTLIEKQVLPSDYVFCMARKKSLKRKVKEFIFKK